MTQTFLNLLVSGHSTRFEAPTGAGFQYTRYKIDGGRHRPDTQAL